MGLPGGKKVEVPFWEEPEVHIHDVPGVVGFQLFPPEGALALVEAIEAWSKSGSAGEVWSEALDSVDDQPEFQLDVFMSHTVKGGTAGSSTSPELRWDTEADPENENFAAIEAILPLAKALCLDMLPPFLAKHRVASDTCNEVFLRKYRADGRPKLDMHQDRSIFTLNVALSDYREVQGGELYMCRQIPQSYAWAMQVQACFWTSEKERKGQGSCSGYMQPFSRIASADLAAQTCSKAQGQRGEAVSTFGSRLHGVFPTEKGTRYSLILFIGRSPDGLEGRDPSVSDEEWLKQFLAESWLSEPFQEAHVSELPKDDALIWLTIVSGVSTMAARGKLRIDDNTIEAFQHKLAGLTTSGSRSPAVRFMLEDVVLAVKYFWEDADLVVMALRCIHALVTVGIQGLEAQRPIILDSPAVIEFTRKAVNAHADRYDVGRLGCAVLENLLCGPDSEEDCAERAPECEEDPGLWEPLEVEPVLHGSTGFDPENGEEMDQLWEECSVEVSGLDGPGAPGEPLNPDCFLFSVLNLAPSTTDRKEPETAGEL